MGDLGSAYAAPPDLEQRLGTADPGTYQALLDAASRAVEGFTGRQFNKTDTATARNFRAVDPHRLPVDDFHTVTDLAITVDGTAWVVADVDPRPWNGVYKGQTGWPFFDLITISKHWPSGRRATVEVTAQWGWAAVPAAIKQATLDVAEVMSYTGSSGVVSSETMDDYSVRYSTPGMTATVSVPAEMIKADPYRRRRFGVA